MKARRAPALPLDAALLAAVDVLVVNEGEPGPDPLAASLAQGAPLATALRRANVAAGLACTRPGTQAAQPGRAEIDALRPAMRA